MRLVRLRWASLAALPLAGVAILAPSVAQAAPKPTFTLLGPGVQTPLIAGDTPVSTFVGDPAELDPSTAAKPTAKFVVTYHGFSAAAKASFQRAVNTWAVNVKSSVPIRIDATYQALGPGILGSAGPTDIFGNSSSKTAAVAALADKLTGSAIQPSHSDITANFSSSFNNWYFGTGKSPSNTYDFQSVVTHEIGHGLGFLGSAQVSKSGQFSVGFTGGYYFTYDRDVKNAAGKSITTFPNGSAALKTQLTSGKLFFSSPVVNKAKIFAPKKWQQGSSYSHLDEATYGPGNPNSLMTPALSPGEQIHSPGPIMLGIFKTMGW